MELMNTKALETEFRPLLSSVGLKTTPGRLVILGALKQASTPLSIEALQEKLSLDIDPATVYRTIDLLLHHNIIRSVDLQHNHAHYELMAQNHHHHVICKSCSAVTDIPYCDIEPILKKAKRKSNFEQITSHSLEIYGICKSCANKKTPR